jgi:hypothetical protein
MFMSFLPSPAMKKAHHTWSAPTFNSNNTKIKSIVQLFANDESKEESNQQQKRKLEEDKTILSGINVTPKIQFYERLTQDDGIGKC